MSKEGTPLKEVVSVEGILLMLLAFTALFLSIRGIKKESIALAVSGQCLGVIVLFMILNDFVLHG